MDALLNELIENPADDQTRLVYQDWLEEHGDVRAEYLRLQAELAEIDEPGKPKEQRRARLRKLKKRLQKSWREWLLTVSQASIEICPSERIKAEAETDPEQEVVEFDFVCPKQWGLLSPTEDQTIRFCDTCRKRVFFCTSVAEANELASFGQCVAIDETVPRRAGDFPEEEREMFLGLVKVPDRLLAARAEDRPEEEEQGAHREQLWGWDIG